MDVEKVRPGQRIRLRQRIERREGDWHNETVGTVMAIKQEKTGSWYAHSKDNFLWLRRIQLKKDDGEITTLTADRFTSIELLSDAPA